MKVKLLTLGLYQSNCYIISFLDKALVVDPGYSDLRILNYLQDNNLTLEAIYLTHGHFDHIGGVNFLKNNYPEVIVYCSQKDKDWCLDLKLSTLSEPVLITHFIHDEDIIALSGHFFTVYETPGHSKGGTILVCDDVAFCGDTIFFEGIGRTDLPGGNFITLTASINKMYQLLSDDTILYPGHGPYTTIKHEKKHNPFVKKTI